MAVLNRAGDARRVRFDWRQENVGDNCTRHYAEFGKTTYRLRDLGTTANALSATVPAHDALVARLRRM